MLLYGRGGHAGDALLGGRIAVFSLDERALKRLLEHVGFAAATHDELLLLHEGEVAPDRRLGDVEAGKEVAQWNRAMLLDTPKDCVLTAVQALHHPSRSVAQYSMNWRRCNKYNQYIAIIFII